MWLNQASKLHCKKDHQKYELARRLAKHVKKIREDYLTDLKSDDVKVKQRAVALYFIDKVSHVTYYVPIWIRILHFN